MNNFLTFINDDIEAKKTLLATMPTNGKRNTKKFNEKIDSILSKYQDYKTHAEKYITTKSKSFEIKEINDDVTEITNKVSTLEYVKFINNPSNTYFEKMGFDNLIYKISNYFNFDFNYLNDIINEFLAKFELVGISILKEEFDLTCYVNEYMGVFLDTKNSKSNNYDEVSKKFEEIYWINPEIVEHLEINFRKLITKYQKKFENYIAKVQKEALLKNKLTDYEDCLDKLKQAHLKLDAHDKEDITDIIELAKQGVIDMNQYFEESKIRVETYENLTCDPLDFENKAVMDEFYKDLSNLRRNVEEYKNYIDFTPLIDKFKKTYAKETKDNKYDDKKLKEIEKRISASETKLDKLKKKIFNNKLSFLLEKDDNKLKILKANSLEIAKELYRTYKEYDQEYFKTKVMTILNESLTISEFLHLYYSFDYFKKIAIKEVFELETYEEVTKRSDDFDLFAMNPNNIIAEGLLLFDENDIPKTIMNKYRLDNINLTDENLEADNLPILLEKITFLLRLNEINNSETSVEKIWFMAMVAKLMQKKV